MASSSIEAVTRRRPPNYGAQYEQYSKISNADEPNLRSENVEKLFVRLKAAVDTASLDDGLSAFTDQVFELIFLVFHPQLVNLYFDRILDEIAPNVRLAILADAMNAVDGCWEESVRQIQWTM